MDAVTSLVEDGGTAGGRKKKKKKKKKREKPLGREKERWCNHHMRWLSGCLWWRW